MTLVENIGLRGGLVMLPLEDDLIVFSEQSQRVIALNHSAAAIVRLLEAGTSANELAQILSSDERVSAEQAELWVSTVLDALSTHGMLNDGCAVTASALESFDDKLQQMERHINLMPPYAPIEPLAEKKYCLLGTCVLIRFAHLGQVRLVDSVIGHLAANSSIEPDVTIEISAVELTDGHLHSDIYQDGKRFAHAARLSKLGPLVKAALWQSAVHSYDFLFYIHSGVVGARKGGILLPASAGSGKSSLTAALTHRGYRYYSDEVALVDRASFRVPPVPLAICVKLPGWEMMSRYYPEVAGLTIHRRDDGKVVRYIPPSASATNQPPMAVSHIIFPRYQQGGKTELRRIARSAALGRLMDECLTLRHRLDADNVGRTVDWIAKIDCYELTFSSLDEAVSCIEDVVTPE